MRARVTIGSVHAAYIEQLGKISEIRYGELPDAEPGAGAVLVRVEAVGVDSVDTFLRSGRWPTQVSFPLALGRDLVGSVVSVGSGVTEFRPGERVWTNSAGYGGRPGAAAELVPWSTSGSTDCHPAPTPSPTWRRFTPAPRRTACCWTGPG